MGTKLLKRSNKTTAKKYKNSCKNKKTIANHNRVSFGAGPRAPRYGLVNYPFEKQQLHAPAPPSSSTLHSSSLIYPIQIPLLASPELAIIIYPGSFLHNTETKF